MEIRAIAPNRIDLAGGTLDLYPLYIFEDGGYTINAAISVWSKVLLRTREDGAVHIYSLDTGAEEHAASVDELALARGAQTKGSTPLTFLRGRLSPTSYSLARWSQFDAYGSMAWGLSRR